MARLVTYVLGAALIYFVSNEIRSFYVLFPLTQAGPICIDQPGIDQGTRARQRNMDAIWQARTQRDVTAELTPFLSDCSLPLSTQAARKLGILENPQAEKSLQAALRNTTDYQARISLLLALGRIESRQLTGKAKINALVKPLRLTWFDVRRLSARVNAPSLMYRHTYAGTEVIESVVDVLNDMGRHGENIQPLAAQLTLTPSQKLIIEGASLSPDEEINHIFDSAHHLQVFNDYSQLSAHLLDLQPRSAELMVQRLRDVQAHPKQYRKTSVPGFAMLFRIAAQMKDPRIVPLLKQFKAHPKPWPLLRDEAEIALNVAGVYSAPAHN